MAHHHPRSALAASRRDVAPESVDLLRRAQRGDREAFGRLYAEHLSVITRYVAVRLRDRDRHAIPDVVHDSFTDALAELAGAHDDVRGCLLRLAAKACTAHEWFLWTTMNIDVDRPGGLPQVARPSRGPKIRSASASEAFDRRK